MDLGQFVASFPDGIYHSIIGSVPYPTGMVWINVTCILVALLSLALLLGDNPLPFSRLEWGVIFGLTTVAGRLLIWDSVSMFPASTINTVLLLLPVVLLLSLMGIYLAFKRIEPRPLVETDWASIRFAKTAKILLSIPIIFFGLLMSSVKTLAAHAADFGWGLGFHFWGIMSLANIQLVLTFSVVSTLSLYLIWWQTGLLFHRLNMGIYLGLSILVGYAFAWLPNPYAGC